MYSSSHHRGPLKSDFASDLCNERKRMFVHDICLASEFPHFWSLKLPHRRCGLASACCVGPINCGCDVFCSFKLWSLYVSPGVDMRRLKDVYWDWRFVSSALFSCMTSVIDREVCHAWQYVGVGWRDDGERDGLVYLIWHAALKCERGFERGGRDWVKL